MVKRPVGHRTRFGIRERLVVWLLVFGLVPVVGTSILGHWLMTQVATEAAGTRFAAVAERIAGLVDAELRHLVSDLGGPDPGFPALARALAGSSVPRPAPGDSAAVLDHPLVARLAEIRDRDPDRYLSVAATDTAGTVIASTDPLASPFLGREEWWQSAWNRGRGAIAMGRLARLNDRWQVTLALPIRDGTDRPLGILTVAADLTDIAGIIREAEVGATGVTAITSGYGDVLITSPAGGRRAPVVNTDRRRRFSTGSPAWYSGRGLLGRDAVIALAPVRTTAGRSFGGASWHVSVEQDKAEVLAPTHLYGRFALGFTLVLAAAVLIVGLFLSGRIARPLHKLRDGARRIGAGRLDLRLDITTRDEIGELAGEFNAMAARLRESYQGLEDRVRTATAELARERNSLEAIVAALGEGLMVVDTGHRVVMWNRTAEAMTGFKAEEVIGRPSEDFLEAEVFHQEGCSPTAPNSRDATDRPPTPSFLVRRDGDRLPVAVTASPLRDADGQDRGCVVILRDVSRELEVDRLKSEVVSTVSHELRSPLTSVVGFAELLNTPGLTDEKRNQYTRFIITEGHRLEQMVDDFLTLSRIESGRLELEFEEVDLRELVAGLFTVEAPVHPRHQLRCDIPPGFPRVRADRERLRRALHNLIDNAIKYSP
ncbi:MAG TPA: sensor histidine kinase, partial [candidate division WOR-3 bacterium]|nr:sensor histidine kinase [candidate division WOR-3 bacterium]